MNPMEMEEKPAGQEAVLGDIESGVFDMLDDKKPLAPKEAAPAAKPRQPPAPAETEEGELSPPAEKPKPQPQPRPQPKPQDNFDPLSPEALASASAKKPEEGGMPADLLKDEEIGRLPEKKQREAFAKERAAHKEARQRMQELVQKVNELSAKAQDAEQLGELRKQLEARDAEAKRLEAEMAKVDLSRSPGFRKQYDDRLNQIGQRMVQAMVTEGVAPEEATKLARALVAEQKPSARESALDESVPSLKGTLLSFLVQFDEIAQQRQVALDKAKETAAAISEAESRARLAAMAGQIDSVVDKAVADAAALGSPYYREVDGQDDWNLAVVERRQALKGLLLTMDPEKLAPYVAEGLTTADLRRRYVEQSKRLKALEAEYQQVIGQRPTFGRVRPDDAPPPPARKAAVGDAAGLEDHVMEALAP